MGGIVGTGVGVEGIPPEWRDGLCEWPRSVRWIETLGARLADVVQTSTPQKELPLPGFGLTLPLRNLLFLVLVLVLAHGVRRLLPPY